MAIHLGRPSPDASRDLPGRRLESQLAGTVVPTRRPSALVFVVFMRCWVFVPGIFVVWRCCVLVLVLVVLMRVSVVDL